MACSQMDVVMERQGEFVGWALCRAVRASVAAKCTVFS